MCYQLTQFATSPVCEIAIKKLSFEQIRALIALQVPIDLYNLSMYAAS